jgi:phosphatidylserine decarboxylase
VAAVLVAPLSVVASGVVAPADGRVSVLREEGGRVRLGVYMRGRDVHVNRAPMAGVVGAVEHEPGTHSIAFRKKAESNERLRFRFENYSLEQIAGALARRTHPYVGPGQHVDRGARIGHISFSSRLDLVFPPGYDLSDLTVDVGDRVRAGEKRNDLKNGPSQPTFIARSTTPSPYSSARSSCWSGRFS